MINLVSTAAASRRASGSGMVFWNLVKGLERIGYPYVVNRDFRATSRLWIHNDVFALRAARRARASTVLGPNLFVMPRDIPPSLRLDGALYLQPSDWAAEVWRRSGFDACPIRVWPVGIDADWCTPERAPSAERIVLVYHKARDPAELERILATLRELGLEHRQITYGGYKESDYCAALARASFVVWHGCHESQGIALLEAMAADVPILVCDATSLAQAYGEDYAFRPSEAAFRTTAAPYFDERCGVKIDDLRELPAAIDRIRAGLGHFRPREYVLENLSLEKQAREFVGLWRYWGLSERDGLAEAASTDRRWRPSALDVVRFRVERRLRRLS